MSFAFSLPRRGGETGSAVAPAPLVRLRPIFRDPLFAFLLVGGALFAGYAAIEASRAEPIHYTQDIEQALVGEFEAVAGRPANQADRDRIRNQFITDELLFREAIERGMHLTDSQTKRHLTDKVRYLIAGAPAEPNEDQSLAYYAANPAKYQAERQITFSQVFFANKPIDPSVTLAALNRGETVKGDDFWLGHDFPRYGEVMVRGIFGQPFVETLVKSPTGEWQGPVQTPRGWHYFRRDETLAPSLMAYKDVRDQVRQDYQISQTSKVIDGEVAKLKEKFNVQTDR